MQPSISSGQYSNINRGQGYHQFPAQQAPQREQQENQIAPLLNAPNLAITDASTYFQQYKALLSQFKANVDFRKYTILMCNCKLVP